MTTNFLAFIKRSVDIFVIYIKSAPLIDSLTGFWSWKSLVGSFKFDITEVNIHAWKIVNSLQLSIISQLELRCKYSKGMFKNPRDVQNKINNKDGLSDVNIV